MSTGLDELVDTQPLEIKNTKPSQWIESLPLDFFAAICPRTDEHTFCGAGLIAEFYGFDWRGYHWKKISISEVTVFNDDFFAKRHQFNKIMDESVEFTKEKLGERFPIGTFDAIVRDEGKQAAKDFTVQWLRKRGL